LKKFYSVVFIMVVFLILNNSGNSQNLFFDDFWYPVRDSLEGMGGWFRSGANSSENIRIVSPGLTYPGYYGSGLGNMVFLNNPTSGGDIVLHNFTAQTSGTLYLSFLIWVDSLSANAGSGHVIGFDQSGGTTNMNTCLYIQKLTSSTYKLGISKTDDASYGNTIYNTNRSYLVIMKYSFISGTDNDSTKMFVYAATVPATEPALPTTFSTAGHDMVNNGQVFISNGYAQTGLKYSSVKIDGIKIGTSWLTSVLHNSIRTISNAVPEHYRLNQNYPNPFNPSTSIKFEVAVHGNKSEQQVRLTVFDINGREVQTLVNERLQPGTYETTFDGSRLNSGVYFYMLRAGGFTETKKLLLVK
jgi:hypothetical protein